MDTSAITIDQELDLRGEVCPYTFVKSKLALEELEQGQVLRVRVDHRPAVDNVPRSMQNEGQEIVAVSEVGPKEWTITIRKAT
ncbi:MAG: sulfurtransferase TusA family protein [Dehalococcoidia bacterium]|nr:sulfurtransferase TusA family protein [Dehalococcoidia bacterium]